MSGIGSFYNKRGVVVGQAIGLFAPEDTPPPADTGIVFDETSWSVTKLALGSPTAGTLAVTMGGGPLAAPVTVTGLAFNVTPTAMGTALQAALPSGYTVLVTGTAGSLYNITIVGPAGAKIAITANGTGLTGGALIVTPPPWTPLGATEQGWQSNYGVSTQDINIEEQITPTGRNITSATYEFTANLAEDSIDNLQVAMASSRTVVAPGAGVYGKTRLNLSSDLPVVAVMLETKNRWKLPRRIYVPGATCAVNVGQTFARARGQHLIPVTFSSVCETERIQIDEITALPTS